MNKEGIPIDDFDPKPAIQRNAENASDWEYSEEAKYIYGMAVLFRDRFLDPVLHTDRGRLPDPVISFDNLRNRKILAAYTLHRNPQGLLDEITFNSVHYKKEEDKKVWAFGRWAQLETLLHEQVHLWQQNFGEHPVKPGRLSHNKEFVEKCESLGLHPMPNVGCHTKVADGVFAQLMGELGVERPDDVPRDEGIKRDWFRPEKKKGRSTLHKWTCPDCGLAVRIGIKDNPHLVHDVCSEKKGTKVFLVKDDGLTHIIYDGEDKEDRPDLISDVNEIIKGKPGEDDEEFTVEGIAETLGIGTKTLYQWAKNDTEFSDALERLKEVQENDPFKTGTSEDREVAAMTLTLLLIETWDRHYKPTNF